MKLKTLFTTALLVAGAVSASQSARAALTYTVGDVFLGFRGTPAVGTENYLVNIGNIAQFSKLDGKSFTVNTGGNISADLSSTFGSTWNTDNRVSWGAIASTYDFSVGSLQTIYATKARNALSIGTQSTPYERLPASTQAGIANDISNALGNQYVTNGTATANSTKGTVQATGLANSWYSFTNTSSDFGNFGGNVDGANFSTTGGRLGTATSVLDFYRIDPSSSGGNAVLLGYFTINDNATITFTAVPEPSTVALAILAGGFFVFWARRRTSSALS